MTERRTSKQFLTVLKRQQRNQSWLVISGWVASIYTMAFFAVHVREFLSSLTNLNFLMTLLFLFILSFFVLSLFQKAGIHKTRTLVLTLSAISVFTFQYFPGTEHAKQYHLVEYSILSYLLYGAFKLDFQGIKVWIFAFAATALIGLGDETLQHFVPGRYSSLMDVVIDMKAAAFGLMFATIAEFEKKLVQLEKKKPARSGF